MSQWWQILALMVWLHPAFSRGGWCLSPSRRRQNQCICCSAVQPAPLLGKTAHCESTLMSVIGFSHQVRRIRALPQNREIGDRLICNNFGESASLSKRHSSEDFYHMKYLCEEWICFGLVKSQRRRGESKSDGRMWSDWRIIVSSVSAFLEWGNIWPYSPPL